MNNIKINTVNIGSHIVKLRKEQHLTQEKLGERINISPTHISTVENGGSYSLNTLITICDGLNTRLDYVLYGNIRDNGKDNLIDLLNLCTNKDIAILEAVAHTLIENKKNRFVFTFSICYYLVNRFMPIDFIFGGDAFENSNM